MSCSVFFHMRSRASVTIAAGLFFVPAISAAPRKATASYRIDDAAAASRYPDVPNLKTLLPRFLNKQGFLDPEFSAQAGVPSPYYTDFYGAQALANTTRQEIQHDFVPKFASVIAEDQHSITLQFKSGYTARFYPHSSLVIKGIPFPFDHVYISGDTWRALEKNLADFRGIIVSNGWQSRYLVPNPEYRAELAVAAEIAKPGPAPVLTVDPDLKKFEAQRNAVLIVPEGVHGIPSTGFDTLYPLLQTQSFDWLGMEMLPASMQPTLDNFTHAPAGSPAYVAARKALILYFANAWNGQSGSPKTTGQDNYYFKLVDEARMRHVRLIGMESSPLVYDVFRYGESSFGANVRSYLWAQKVPLHGRGVVYGGSAHFTSPRPTNFQNFLQRRDPSLRFFVLKPLHVRP